MIDRGLARDGAARQSPRGHARREGREASLVSRRVASWRRSERSPMLLLGFGVWPLAFGVGVGFGAASAFWARGISAFRGVWLRRGVAAWGLWLRRSFWRCSRLGGLGASAAGLRRSASTSASASASGAFDLFSGRRFWCSGRSASAHIYLGMSPAPPLPPPPPLGRGAAAARARRRGS